MTRTVVPVIQAHTVRLPQSMFLPQVQLAPAVTTRTECSSWFTGRA